MSNRRRELLRPFLKSYHAGLCDTKVPVTSLLFWSNLSKTLKESREANKLGREQRGKQTRERSVLQIKKLEKNVIQVTICPKVLKSFKGGRVQQFLIQ